MHDIDSMSDREALQHIFDEMGVAADVREELESLVASAAAEVAFYAVVAFGGASFLKSFGEEFGKLQAQRVDRGLSSLASLIAQVCRRRRVLLVEKVDGRRVIEVQLDPDLPDEAYERLADVLPQVPPVGRLTWDRRRRRWCDPFDRDGPAGS